MFRLHTTTTNAAKELNSFYFVIDNRLYNYKYIQFKIYTYECVYVCTYVKSQSYMKRDGTTNGN